jgi:hypothetical protein
MTKYKLNITFDFNIENDSNGVALLASNGILSMIKSSFGDAPLVSLVIEGDRSGANYLAPINDRHYKHGKVPLSEIKLD